MSISSTPQRTFFPFHIIIIIFFFYGYHYTEKKNPVLGKLLKKVSDLRNSMQILSRFGLSWSTFASGASINWAKINLTSENNRKNTWNEINKGI